MRFAGQYLVFVRVCARVCACVRVRVRVCLCVCGCLSVAQRTVESRLAMAEPIGGLEERLHVRAHNLGFHARCTKQPDMTGGREQSS
jgi:hypothetical protein